MKIYLQKRWTQIFQEKYLGPKFMDRKIIGPKYCGLKYRRTEIFAGPKNSRTEMLPDLNL